MKTMVVNIKVKLDGHRIAIETSDELGVAATLTISAVQAREMIYALEELVDHAEARTPPKKETPA